MPEEETNEIPEEEARGLSLKTVVIVAIILIILVVIWAFVTKRIP